MVDTSEYPLGVFLVVLVRKHDLEATRRADLILRYFLHQRRRILVALDDLHVQLQCRVFQRPRLCEMFQPEAERVQHCHRLLAPRVPLPLSAFLAFSPSSRYFHSMTPMTNASGSCSAL